MSTFQEELNKATNARAIFERLKKEKNMSNIADIVSSINEETAKMVLKCFVYDR